MKIDVVDQKSDGILEKLFVSDDRLGFEMKALRETVRPKLSRLEEQD